MSAKTIPDVHNEVQIMKNDMTKVSTLVDRLDITIDKLTEVASNVSQLLAIQGSRLEFQEKNHVQLQVDLERKHLETHKSIEEIYTEMNNIEKEHDKEIKEIHTDVVSRIEKIENIFNDRIGRLEKWMWILIGGLTVVTFFFQDVNWGVIF